MCILYERYVKLKFMTKYCKFTIFSDVRALGIKSKYNIPSCNKMRTVTYKIHCLLIFEGVYTNVLCKFQNLLQTTLIDNQQK